MKENKLQCHRQKWSRCFKLALIAVFMLSCNLFALAQAQKISGKVTDANTGESLVGVSVYVKGTTTGTVTDVNGLYTLNALPNGQKIIFSFLGMKTLEITTDGKTTYDVTLEPEATGIEGVVITALGIKRDKKALGYSVGEVKPEAIVNSSETNVVTALSGKVAGVVVNSTSSQAGSGANITIRGNSSITGSNAPLMIVDGLPYQNNQFGADAVGGETGNTSLDLDLSTIENVSVLKGAAAAALYGSQAANGVILVTTKKGNRNMKPAISFSQSFSWDKFIELPQQKTWAQGNWNAALGEWVYQDGEPHADGGSGYTSASWGPKIADVPGAVTYDKYSIFQTGKLSETNISVRGGTDKVTYFTSFSNYSQQGILEQMTMQKNSITSNVDVRVTDKFKVSTGLNFTKYKNNRFWEGFSNSSFMTTFLSQPWTWNPYPTYAEDGTLRSYRGGSRNPYTWLVDNMIRAIDRVRFTPNVGIEYQINEALRFTARSGIDFYSNTKTDQINSGGYDYPTGLYDVQINQNFFVNTDFILAYNKKISNDFSLDGLVGNNIQTTTWEGSGFTGTGFVLPDIYNQANCSSTLPAVWKGQQRSTSLYAQLSLAYKSLLYFSASARQDWTSTLPQETRWNPYPSASLAFIFTELMGKNNTLSFGKISASYSAVGNTPAAYSNSFSQNVPWLGWSGFTLPYNGQTGFFPSTTALNPNLQAEKSKEIEFNLDTKFFQSRIGLELSIYKSWSENQIMNVNLETSTGYGAALMNIGSIDNRGIELQLTATAVKTKDFTWDITVNWSKNKTNVIQLGLNGDPINLAYDLWAVEGSSFPCIYAQVYQRDANGAMVIDDDPASSSYGYPLLTNEREVIGKVEPDWLGGIRNTFYFKNFTLNAFIDTRQGGVISNGTDSYLKFYGLTTATEDRPDDNHFVMDGVAGHYNSDGEVVTNGTNTASVRYDNFWKSYTSLESTVQSSDFIKFRELSLFYNFPQKVLEKLKYVKSLTLGFVGRNIWFKYADDYTGGDPEASNFGDNSSQEGMSWYMFPNTRTYSFKLSFTF
jgi:TonB-linked SusC/RagA family outer membrane protein